MPLVRSRQAQSGSCSVAGSRCFTDSIDRSMGSYGAFLRHTAERTPHAWHTEDTP
jgi:hypothetical protein